MPKDTAATASSSGSGADAAGGEAIYSSDGLPPLPAPVPPVTSSGATDDADNVLDSDHVSPAAAFEVFGGKAYLRPGGGGGGRSVATGNIVAGSSSGTRTGLSVEPPLVRLARLSAELSELERDLETTTTSSAAAAGAVSSEELTQLARELSSRLEVLSNQHGIVAGTGSGNSRTLSDNLTRLVREELAKASSSDAASAAAASESGGGGIVYELYASSATGHVGPTSAASAASEASIAERLGRIERAVGSTSSASAIVSTSAASGGESDSRSGRSVLERLEGAERMAGRVDAKALDAAAARAKVIRADLEAAAKAKTKLSAALSTLSADDARIISDLHTQLQDLEGVSAHLPAITSRLQDLSALHLQASTFATRLTSVENATREAERLLRGVEEAVSKVEDGWKANASAVESNVAALDERIKSLS
mmetsp:Transcript_6598/g.15816  ORF Transcript_6598/g.15816 Transcript_6598/m.15816 type:complete len:425 (+) Transcript_6598:17-1291(+)